MARYHWLVLIVLTFLQCVGFGLFSLGFFPSKTLLSGVNDFNFTDNLLLENLSNHEESKIQFHKLIFVVIDALRSDFMFSKNSSMSNIHNLLNNNEAIGFTAFSNPPTVTLPRLKGITTGSTSNFLDAILNIDEDSNSDSSNLINQDSWIKQFSKYKKNGINFFGDDTWLKLFPNLFNKTDGTSSFFVSDFTEVDNNVTRHIETELLNDDEWDGLILHYLGLDHIGHKNGPSSVFMPNKQKELDEIIFSIYRKYSVPKFEENQNVLMIVLGDHGMNEIGNHGGSSISETSAGLTFISPVFKEFFKSNNNFKAPLPINEDFEYFEKINQVDLVPTICSFFNLPIPKNSIGILIKKFLLMNDIDEIFFKLNENAYQFKELIENNFKNKKLSSIYNEGLDINKNDEFELLNKLWNESVLKFTDYYQINPNMDNTELNNELIENYYLFLIETQDFLQTLSTNYNLNYLKISLTILIFSSLIIFINLFKIFYKEFQLNLSFFAILSVIMTFSTFGSSLIEEEHQLWWLFNLIFIIFIIIYSFKFYPSLSLKTLFSYSTITLSLIRLIRFWNCSGQKFNFQEKFLNLKVSFFIKNFRYYKNLNFWFIFLVIILHSQLLNYGGLNLIHYSFAFVLPFTISLLILTFKINFEFINTNGKDFNSFFQKIVHKSTELWLLEEDINDNNLKIMLINLAKLIFIMIIGLFIFRLILSKFSLLWINTMIINETNEYEKIESNSLSAKNQLIKKQNQKIKNQFVKKRVYKKTDLNGYYKLLPDLANLINLILIMQSKVENIGIFFLFFLIRELVSKFINRLTFEELKSMKIDTKFEEDDKELNDFLKIITKRKILIFEQKYHLKLSFFITLQTILLQQLSFFQFSFTNSLSTVDLSNAYNGVESYNLILVGILTFISNFQGPIYWSFNSLIWLFDNGLIKIDNINDKSFKFVFDDLKKFKLVKNQMLFIRWFTILSFYILFGTGLCFACYILKNHLFIWTVFSPKLLFFGVWNFLVSILLEFLIFLFFIFFI